MRKRLHIGRKFFQFDIRFTFLGWVGSLSTKGSIFLFPVLSHNDNSLSLLAVFDAKAFLTFRSQCLVAWTSTFEISFSWSCPLWSHRILFCVILSSYPTLAERSSWPKSASYSRDYSLIKTPEKGRFLGTCGSNPFFIASWIPVFAHVVSLFVRS